MEPKVLLLDEPTAGLDERATERVAEILLELPQAMVLVSHDRVFMDQGPFFRGDLLTDL